LRGTQRDRWVDEDPFVGGGAETRRTERQRAARGKGDVPAGIGHVDAAPAQGAAEGDGLVDVHGGVPDGDVGGTGCAATDPGAAEVERVEVVLLHNRGGVNLAGEADDDGGGEDEICELGFHGFVVIQGLDWVFRRNAYGHLDLYGMVYPIRGVICPLPQEE